MPFRHFGVPFTDGISWKCRSELGKDVAMFLSHSKSIIEAFQKEFA
jgi:hypothetical protein